MQFHSIQMNGGFSRWQCLRMFLESYAGLGLRDLYRLDVGWSDGEAFPDGRRIIRKGEVHTALGMRQIDMFQEVGDETGIAPCVGITSGIRLSQQGAVFRPGSTGEVVAVLFHPPSGDLHQLVDGEVGKLKTVRKP